MCWLWVSFPEQPQAVFQSGRSRLHPRRGVRRSSGGSSSPAFAALTAFRLRHLACVSRLPDDAGPLCAYALACDVSDHLLASFYVDGLVFTRVFRICVPSLSPSTHARFANSASWSAACLVLSTGSFPAEVSDAAEVWFSNVFFCGCVFGVENLLPRPRS